MDYDSQKQLDQLSGVYGNEQAVREELQRVSEEIRALETALSPLLDKREELEHILERVEDAKAEARQLKAAEPAK